ncbi:MAG: phospholipase D-like domain-containing protein [Acidobacteriota bacterium]|nr:phospholipase D-like domain-containing protein [Acidobacteriota bacterium]
MRSILPSVGLMVVALLAGNARAAAAVDEFCDPSFQNCRTPLITLINNERVGIDAAWWFMEDSRYATAIINRWKAGVPVRILIDTRANASYPLNKDNLALIKDAGIPMREKTSGGILHWKMMLFAGQGQVEFSGANYSSVAFMYNEPYVNYIDELIYFTDDSAIVNSFQTKFDDVWMSTSGYSNYANITSPLTRVYATYPISAEMNFPPGSDFATRSVGRYNAETTQIDAIMYRITDRRHTDALIAAMNRGVRVRLITEPKQYRDATRLWHSWNVDRLYVAMLDANARSLAGGAIKHRAHPGLSHEKMTVLYGQTLSIFGSSNWTGPSANSQLEHNIFTKRQWMFDYGVEHFNRKWDNSNPVGSIETEAFVPLPPDRPTYVSPINGATGQSQTPTLRWHAGPWAHKYDIYLSTDPAFTAPIAVDVALGPSESANDYANYPITTPLEPGTQYYWRVVSKTMANMTATGTTWSFVTTGGTPVSTGSGDVNLYAANTSRIQGRWSRVADSTAAGGFRLSNANAGAAKITQASAEPADYFEMTFNAVAGIPYHLWVRGKAVSNNYNNDSVYVQFSTSTLQGGAPTWRIGSTSAAAVTIEDCSSCGLADWGWNDNSYGGLGVPVYFSDTGPVTVRVQVREDGLSIDQILLSPDKFLSISPGAVKFDVKIYPEASGGVGLPTEPPPPSATEVDTRVIHAGVDSTRIGAWTTVADNTAAGGQALMLPNTGRAKVSTALAEPADYAELTVQVEPGRAYRLWLRGKATSNSYGNDSVFVQFSGAVDENGTPIYRIGATEAAVVNLEDCSGCGLSGWGWQDNGWGTNVLGPRIYFGAAGTQTIRIQNREDGLRIDQVILSPDTYLNTPPGSLQNDATIYPRTP